MPRNRDAEGRRMDAHAKLVAEAQKTLKELEALVNYHEALLLVTKQKLMPGKRKR